jgi:hypothetical protein
MNLKLKDAVLAASLALNALAAYAVILYAAASPKTSLFSSPAPQDGYIAAAAITRFPAASNLAFLPVSITLNPSQKFYLQYSVISGKKQSDFIFPSLYDPDVISVTYADAGMEITAMNAGQTIIQTVTNDGFKDIASVTVTVVP